MPFCHVPPSRAIRDRAHIWNYYLPPFHMAVSYTHLTLPTT